MAVSRKIAQGLYGGHQPRDVAAAVALGILAGMLAGGNLSWAPVLLAAILFNVHTRLFLAAWLASLVLAWLCRGWLEVLGQFLLDGTPLGGTIGLLGDGTLVALFGWDEYALVGGLAAGTAAAIACAPIAYWITRRLEHRWVPTRASVPTGEAGTEDGAQRTPRPLVRIWYGPSSRERAVRQTMAPRRLRPCGIPASLAAAVTVAIASWSLVRLSVERELWRQLSVYNGARVSCSRSRLSLYSGDFVVHDLAIADAARPDRDRFRIGLAKGRLSPGPLLRGRLQVERLVLTQVRADVARLQPAELCDSCGGNPDVDLDPVAAVDGDVPGYSPSPGDVEISPYVRSWPSVCRRLAVLEQLVGAIERLPYFEDIRNFSQADGSLTRRRSDLGRPQPRLAVQELRVDGLPRAWNLGGKALVEIANLTSNPSLATKPAQIRVLLPKFGAEVQLDFASQQEGPHAIRCSACDVDVAQWIDAPLAVSGRAQLAGQGSFDGRRIDMRLVIEVESLAAEVTGEERLVGVEPELWNRGLRQLATCNAEVVCSGRWAAPGLVVDGRRLVEQFNRQLRAGGQEDLVATIEQQMARHLAGQAGLQEEQPAARAVVQATAIEAQAPGMEMQAAGSEVQPEAIEPPMPPPQAGLCESSADEVPRPAGEDTGSYSNFIYPTTSVPYDDTRYASAPAAVAYDDAERASPPLAAVSVMSPAGPGGVRQRPLPGPVNMVVGRDRYSGLGADAAPREGVWARWTQGLRQKFGHAFARPERAPAESPEAVESRPVPQYDDRPIPAAASQAWYNRQWR